MFRIKQEIIEIIYWRRGNNLTFFNYLYYSLRRWPVYTNCTIPISHYRKELFSDSWHLQQLYWIPIGRLDKGEVNTCRDTIIFSISKFVCMFRYVQNSFSLNVLKRIIAYSWSFLRLSITFTFDIHIYFFITNF